jgi:hypothetical protein
VVSPEPMSVLRPTDREFGETFFRARIWTLHNGTYTSSFLFCNVWMLRILVMGFLGWFQVLSWCITFSSTLSQLSLSLSSTPHPHGSSSSLYHLAHSHISLFSLNQHHHSILNHFRIYFLDNKIEKTIV